MTITIKMNYVVFLPDGSKIFAEKEKGKKEKRNVRYALRHGFPL